MLYYEMHPPRPIASHYSNDRIRTQNWSFKTRQRSCGPFVVSHCARTKAHRIVRFHHISWKQWSCTTLQSLVSVQNKRRLIGSRAMWLHQEAHPPLIPLIISDWITNSICSPVSIFVRTMTPWLTSLPHNHELKAIHRIDFDRIVGRVQKFCVFEFDRFCVNVDIHDNAHVHHHHIVRFGFERHAAGGSAVIHLIDIAVHCSGHTLQFVFCLGIRHPDIAKSIGEHESFAIRQ